jgi:hypothetical protein
VPAVATTLALLAMSPRLLLQPACVSYFLLGLTFYLLWRPHADEGARPWWLLGVFLLWVNVDEWFLLGPVLVALFWLGERLRGQRQTPGWLVPAGLAVCLLNPYGWHAFTLPAELSAVPWTSGLRQDVRFQAQFASPWQPAYLHAAARLNAAVLAYYALTALGLLSFLAHPPALGGLRLLVWLPFALLAAWQARLIPFFAVVAAPIAALNAQDFLAGRTPSASRIWRSRWAAPAGHLALVAVLLALIALTWPGWLAEPGHQGRNVAWGIQPDPSLRQAAETLQDWRQRGLLPEGERVFGVAPELAQYGAWFFPGERYFFDHRYPLFAGPARDYETVCRVLLPGLGRRDEGAGAKDWGQVLKERGVTVVAFWDRDPQRLLAVLRRVTADREHWTLLQVAGQVLLAGWNEARPRGFAALAFDADRLAFGPQDERARQALPPPPEKGVEHLPSSPSVWERLARLPAPPAWESAAAAVFLYQFEDGKPVQIQEQLMASWRRYAASLVGLPTQPAAALQVASQLFEAQHVIRAARTKNLGLLREQRGPFFAAVDEQPPTLPLLAVRAARRAVAENPDDARAWLCLGQAYLWLRNDTCENSAEGLLPPLAEVRSVQCVTALEQAVRLDPDLESAHHELTRLYGVRNFLDAALAHQREELRLRRQAGARQGESAEDLADRLERLENDTAKLEAIVDDRRQKFAAAAPRLQGDKVAQATLALRMGLARQAVEESLLPTPAALLNAPGIKLELELLLALGRVEEVRTILTAPEFLGSKEGLQYRDLPPPLGADGRPVYSLPYHWPAVDWMQLLEAAAVGDQVQARAALRTIRGGWHTGNDLIALSLRELEQNLGRAPAGLLAGPPVFVPAYAAQRLGWLAERKAALRMAEPVLRAQQADLFVLEGLLALEHASPDAARSAFTEAQKLGGQAADGEVHFAGAPIAASYLQRLLGYE